jgi:hypothetical protein
MQYAMGRIAIPFQIDICDNLAAMTEELLPFSYTNLLDVV